MRRYVALGEQIFENFHSIRISGMSKRFKSREDLALRPENVFISGYPIEHIIFPEFDRSAFPRQTEFKEKKEKKKGKKRKVERKKGNGRIERKGKKKGKWERTEGKDDEKGGAKRNGEKRNERTTMVASARTAPYFLQTSSGSKKPSEQGSENLWSPTLIFVSSRLVSMKSQSVRSRPRTFSSCTIRPILFMKFRESPEYFVPRLCLSNKFLQRPR